MSAARLRVVLADDVPLLRMAMRMALTGQGGVEIVGEAADGFEAVQLARELAPDVVLMDLAMPGMDGPDAIAAIRREGLAVRVVVLSAFQDRARVQKVLALGADGYLLKSAQAPEMLTAMRQACAGQAYVSPELADILRGAAGGGA